MAARTVAEWAVRLGRKMAVLTVAVSVGWRDKMLVGPKVDHLAAQTVDYLAAHSAAR